MQLISPCVCGPAWKKVVRPFERGLVRPKLTEFYSKHCYKEEPNCHTNANKFSRICDEVALFNGLKFLFSVQQTTAQPPLSCKRPRNRRSAASRKLSNFFQVKENLPYPNAYNVAKDELASKMDMESPVSMCLPSTAGKGRCALLMVDYLIDKQNKLLLNCQELLPSAS